MTALFEFKQKKLCNQVPSLNLSRWRPSFWRIEDHYWFWPEICWTERFSWMLILLQKGFQPFVHDNAKIKWGEIQNICLHHLNSGFRQLIVSFSRLATLLVLNFHNICVCWNICNLFPPVITKCVLYLFLSFTNLFLNERLLNSHQWKQKW